MPYVMVPVPEEYVEEVMQMVLRARARESIEQWTAESLTELFNSVDEVTRSLLSYVARANAAGKDLSEAEAAASLQLTVRETLGVLRELNDIARDANRPGLIGRRTMTETLPNGRETEKRVFGMADDIAALVREAERAELAEAREQTGTP